MRLIGCVLAVVLCSVGTGGGSGARGDHAALDGEAVGRDQAHPSRAASEILQAAQEAYIAGRYADAIALAKQVQSADPQRAGRIIGASSCFLGDAPAATAAWRTLNASGKQFVAYVCARNHVAIDAP